MSDNTKIHWTNATWNVFVGCTKKSNGCKNCSAIRDAHRLSHNPHPKIRAKYAGTVTEDGQNWTGRINFDEATLFQPLHWKKPRRIFVNYTSDTFHANVPDEWIDRLFAVMALAPQHTFQVLTKRPERMRDYFMKRNEEWTDLGVSQYADEFDFNLLYENGELKQRLKDAGWWLDWNYTEEGKKDISHPIYGGKIPFPNVWLGTSVEDQKTADERIPPLLQTPAAVRWISAEPLLGPVDLEGFLDPTGFQCIDPDCVHCYRPFINEDDYATTKDNDPICLDCGEVGTWTGYENGLDWVVVGGESGSNARPMHPDWVRALRFQCNSKCVPFFFKQWGSFIEWNGCDDPCGRCVIALPDATLTGFDWIPGPQLAGGIQLHHVSKKTAGRMLDGRTWDEFPILTGAHH